MRTSFFLCAIALTVAVELSAQDGGYEYQDKGFVQQTVEDVMARPEFERLRDAEDEASENSAWLESVLEWLDWIEQWLAGGNVQQERDMGSGIAYLVYGVAFLIVSAALAFILKSVLESAKERELASEQQQTRLMRAGAAPGETPPENFWARAQELAARGNEKLAIRELLFGAMSSLERRGLIRHRRGLTNRDYLGQRRAACAHLSGRLSPRSSASISGVARQARRVFANVPMRTARVSACPILRS